MPQPRSFMRPRLLSPAQLDYIENLERELRINRIETLARAAEIRGGPVGFLSDLRPREASEVIEWLLSLRDHGYERCR